MYRVFVVFLHLLKKNVCINDECKSIYHESYIESPFREIIFVLPTSNHTETQIEIQKPYGNSELR